MNTFIAAVLLSIVPVSILLIGAAFILCLLHKGPCKN